MRFKFCLVLALLVGLSTSGAMGQYVLEDAHDPNRYGNGTIVLPFAFYTSSYRFGGGVVVDSTGLLQPQTDVFALALGSVNGSYGLLGGIENIRLTSFARLFTDIDAAFFQENQYTAYIDSNQTSRRSPAGSNDSSRSDFFVTQDDDSWGSIKLRYLLPIGGGRDVVINRYVLEDGLLKAGQTGGDGWDPLSIGRTYVQVTPFYEYQTLETPGHDRHFDTSGVRFGVVYDNTDFPANPSSGNTTLFTVSRDFGLFSSSNAWTTLTGQFTQYVDLGTSSFFRQQVVALQAWSCYSPTWTDNQQDGRRVVTNAPPFYEGAVLGGRDRLRGFDDGRFHDRAALYGSVEVRVVPRWNPFQKFDLLKKADITWMQWVLFAETGRVANEYSPELLSHLKGDVGFGLRILANDTLVRIDAAASSEGYSVWIGLGQPF